VWTKIFQPTTGRFNVCILTLCIFCVYVYVIGIVYVYIIGIAYVYIIGIVYVYIIGIVYSYFPLYLLTLLCSGSRGPKRAADLLWTNKGFS